MTAVIHKAIEIFPELQGYGENQTVLSKLNKQDVQTDGGLNSERRYHRMPW